MNEKYPLALNEGTVLAGQYIIEDVLGQGGFGITYVATDHKSGSKVAIKEFFPDTLATRDGTSVMSFTGERAEGFEYGKNCFLQEAKTLAQFIDNDNIIRIYTYFEENSTAYFVMEYVEGESFDEYIKKKGGKISFEEASKLLIPVMDALASVHDKGIVHRDVTPDNIFICDDGKVKLLDFGAARYSVGDKSKSLDVVLKHGFAPKEQYTRHGRQGAFTDVYSLGATFYYAITGKKLPDSIDRLEDDNMVPPSNLGVKIPEDKEEVLFKAISVQPQDRFQNMRDFSAALKGEVSQDIGKTVAVNVGSTPTEDTGTLKASGSNKKGFVLPAIIVSGCVIVAAVIIGIIISANKPKTNADLEEPVTVAKTENQTQSTGSQSSGNGGVDASGQYLTSIENIGYFAPIAISNINNGGIVADSDAGTFVAVPNKGLCLYTVDDSGAGNYELLVETQQDLGNINVVGDKVIYTLDGIPYLMNADGSNNGRSSDFAENVYIKKLYANENGCFVLGIEDATWAEEFDLYYKEWKSGKETPHFAAFNDSDIAIWENEMFFISPDQKLVRFEYADLNCFYASNDPNVYAVLQITQTEIGENEMIMYTSYVMEDDQSWNSQYHTNYYWRAADYLNSRQLEGYSYNDDFAALNWWQGRKIAYYKGKFYFTALNTFAEIENTQTPRLRIFTSELPDRSNGEKTQSEIFIELTDPPAKDSLNAFGFSERYEQYFYGYATESGKDLLIGNMSSGGN